MSRTESATVRVRTPRPLLPRRLPSGRGATEQPNNTAAEPGALTAVFWAALVATGLLAGAAGVGLTELLHGVEHLAFGGVGAPAVARSSDGRRIAALVVTAALTGPAWWLLGLALREQRTDLDDALWRPGRFLGWRRCLGTSLLSEVAVGGGASLGREAAPKLMGAATGGLIARRLHFTPGQAHLLIACGAGAGMGCVYQLPLAGGLFAAELMIGSLALPVVLPALLCSGIACGVAALDFSTRPTYVGIPGYATHPGLVVFAAVMGPVLGLLAVAWVRLIGNVSARRARGWRVAIAPLVAFTAVGLVSLHEPLVVGNGQDIARAAFVGALGSGTLAVLALAKPLLTGLCLGSGATGGLFTPTLALGAVAGGLLGAGWQHLGGHAAPGAYAVIGAAALLGAGMQAPLAALVCVLELTRTSDSLAIPLVLATAGATIVARAVDGYSIYSARLPEMR